VEGEKQQRPSKTTTTALKASRNPNCAGWWIDSKTKLKELFLLNSTSNYKKPITPEGFGLQTYYRRAGIPEAS
jgi:hypothetical protein